MGDAKHLLSSKTFWTNLLGPVFLWIGAKYGINLDPDTQAVVIVIVMSLVNILVRCISHEAVTLSFANYKGNKK